MSDSVEIPVEVLREWSRTLTKVTIYLDDPPPIQDEFHEITLASINLQIKEYLPREPLPVVPKPERWSITCTACERIQTWNDDNRSSPLFRREDFGPEEHWICEGCGAPLAIQAPAEVTP